MAFFEIGQLYTPLCNVYSMLEVKHDEPEGRSNQEYVSSVSLAPETNPSIGLWQPIKNEMREPHHTLWGEPSRWTNSMRHRAGTWPSTTVSTARRSNKDHNDFAPPLGLSKIDAPMTVGPKSLTREKPTHKVDIENLKREPKTAALLALFETSVPYRHELRVLYNTLPHKPLFKRLLADIRARDPQFAADQAVAFAPMDPLAMTLAIRASGGRSGQPGLQEKEKVKEEEGEKRKEKEEEDEAAVKRAHVMLLLHILECLREARYTEMLQPVRESVQLWERMAGTEM